MSDHYSDFFEERAQQEKQNKRKATSVSIELEDHVVVALALEAHARNMKMNDLMINVIKNYLVKEMKS